MTKTAHAASAIKNQLATASTCIISLEGCFVSSGFPFILSDKSNEIERERERNCLMFFLLLRRITDARICVSLCALCCAVPLCHLPRSVQKTSRWPDNSMSFVYTFPTRTLSLSSLHNQKANDSIHIV